LNKAPHLQMAELHRMDHMQHYDHCCYHSWYQVSCHLVQRGQVVRVEQY
jgi:hypothetical protein